MRRLTKGTELCPLLTRQQSLIYNKRLFKNIICASVMKPYSNMLNTDLVDDVKFCGRD